MIRIITSTSLEEVATNTGGTPINETHSIATFIGNGTIKLVIL